MFAFDWWIRNADRTLTDAGGNPNLFWDARQRSLVVIDHNQAFDPDFSPQDFLQLHVFAHAGDHLLSDWIARNEYAQRFGAVVGDFDAIVASLPPHWHFEDDEQTVPADFDFVAAEQVLARCQSPDFWSIR